MTSPTERVLRILIKWQTNSAKLRIKLATDNVFMSCRGRVYSVEDRSWIWCIGDGLEHETRFDLEGAAIIESTNCDKAPERFDSVTDMTDEFVSITWADGTRLNLVTEHNPYLTRI